MRSSRISQFSPRFLPLRLVVKVKRCISQLSREGGQIANQREDREPVPPNECTDSVCQMVKEMELNVIFVHPFTAFTSHLLSLLADWQSQKWSQWILVRAVSTSKLLSVSLLADNSPLMHHEPGNTDEENGGERAGNHKDTDPSNDLEEVVWAGNPVEAESLWNTTGSSSLWSKVGENDVGVKVGKLAVDVSSETAIDEPLNRRRKISQVGGSSRVWSEDPVGDVEASQHPVVERVAENVGSWHCGSRELVDEDGLQLALDEVQEHHPDAHDLNIAQRLLWCAEDGRWVDVWAERTGEESDQEEWAGVLDEVNGAPGDLWPEILNVNGGLGGDTSLGCEKRRAVLDNGLGLWVDNGEAVVVAGACGLSQELLGLLDSGG